MTNYKKEQRKKEKSAQQAAVKPSQFSTPSASVLVKTVPMRNDPLPALSAKTPEQERAAFALKGIKKLAEEWQTDLKKQKEFNSYASSMPFMIHANGLGQTAAFYRRKGTEHTYYKLYKLLGDWLNQSGRPFANKGDLLDAITQSDQDAYLAAQIEALLFLDWVKKLASAFLAREDDNAGNQQP
ncbi:type III-B CRISPR module-associated protein Cmr5 [Chromatium okenii]|jgi:CRISPR-associated protein Cmr5|uniref:type III-B CRISPR module-associated protein Cmr5 n=1 Tax=Chromatium okenii TaxID=61644 RepID=UPI0026F14AFF|nr:type III-B CRISPR module-associated protein Cmr5 [Chromatium okenii]MBV5310963.1 type III-B CRISPR module-associated protein Cmr5 [Chromatium okenii]